MNGIRVLAFAIFLPVCHAETLTVLRGRVESDSPFLGNEIMAELRSLDGRYAAQPSPISNDGTFEFQEVEAGNYHLRLTTLFGAQIYEQTVNIFSYVGQISIRLPAPSRQRPVSGTVSVGELQRPAPPKALRAFADAQRHAESGKPAEAMKKLELALRLHPEYAAARSNLGVQYVRLGRYEQALEEFEKAAAIGPPSALLYSNLCFAYHALSRWAEAEQSARKALTLDPRYGRAHYLLGSTLARQVRADALEKAPEAARHLRLGARDVPRAHIDIAQIYLTEGDPLSAAAEYRLYLQSGNTEHRAHVEKILASMP